MSIGNYFRKRRLFFTVISGLLLCLVLTSCASRPAILKTEVYFSSEDSIGVKIVEVIDGSYESIDIAMFDFTSEKIKAALEKASGRGVKIRIIADNRQAGGAYSVVKSLSGENISVETTGGKSGGVMHHKFAIFDKLVLLTGSYNWTKNAEDRNFENAVFISDSNAIKKYQKEFDAIWLRAENEED